MEVENLAVFQYDVVRILQVYLIQGLVFLFFVYLSILILKRDKKRLNRIFSGFYTRGKAHFRFLLLSRCAKKGAELRLMPQIVKQ